MMTTYALFGLVSAYMTGFYWLRKHQRLRYALYGSACIVSNSFLANGLQVTNLIGLGLLDYTRNKDLIVIFSFILQAIGGIGNGMSIPASIAMLCSYKDERAYYIGYYELVAGLGALIGPILGSSLYGAMGYKGPFLGLGTLYLVPVLIFLPRVAQIEESKAQQWEDGNQGCRRLNACEITRSSRAGFGFVVQLVSYLAMSFNIPLLSNHLDSKGFSPMFIGYSMASVSIAYLLMMPFTFKLMKTMSRRGVIFIGLCLITNGMMITGLDNVYEF